MKKTYRLLLILHAIVGLGAIGGGLAAILNPETPIGITPDVLRYSPFDNFLIPGIILFTVIGVGNVLSAVNLAFKSKYQGYISSVFSWALVIWIIVQCIMLRSVVFLHVLFFAIGIVEAICSAIIMFEQRLFPTKILIGLADKLKKDI